jgi:glutamyl-tRNA reductase
MAIHFDHWDKAAADADILISSTNADGRLVTPGKLAPVMKGRGDRPLFVIDLAVPRDADPAINDMEGVFLHDVDSLQQIAAESLVIRQREVERCESLIESHVGGFMNWLQSLHNPEWQR